MRKRGEAKAYLLDVAVSFDGDECLTWPFLRMQNGYARLFWRDNQRLAHRIICQLVHGDPPTPKHHAAHSCGKGHEGCVNPKHLSWKTCSENQADKNIHGTDMRGVKHHNAKLDEDAVRVIRSLRRKVLQKDLADRFGVSVSRISSLQNGHDWDHLNSNPHELSLPALRLTAGRLPPPGRPAFLSVLP